LNSSGQFGFYENSKPLDTGKIKRPTLRIFKKSRVPNRHAHLAHAIAAQTHRDTKAMARAKSSHALAESEKCYIR